MKKLITSLLLLITVFGLTTLAQAQQPPESGSLMRITQLVYDSADVYMDGAIVLEDLAYTLTSDYLPLTAGNYVLAVVPAGGDATSGVSVNLEVVDGHRYTVSTTGTQDGTVNLLVIDETADVLTQTDSIDSYAIIINNVTASPAVDVYFNDELIGSNMAYGGYILANVAPGKIASRATLAGYPDSTVFTSDYFIMPNSVSQASLAGDFTLFTSGERFPYERFALRVSDDNLADFLTNYNSVEGNNLSVFFSMLTTAGMLDQLNGEGTFTIFAPANAAFEALPPGTLDALLTDPAALQALLSYHIVPSYFPSYALVGEQMLTTMHSAALSSSFVPGVSWTLNASVQVGLENRASNGVIYIIDTVMTPPAE